MSKFKITRLDVTNDIGPIATISMDINIYGGVSYAMLCSLKGLIEDDIDYNYDRIIVINAERFKDKSEHFSNSRYNVTPADIAAAARFGIRRVIFNSPATIVFWGDGTKTVVKCQEGDKFIPETGLAMCFMKKVLGNKSNFNNIFKKWIKDKTIGDIFNELSKDEQKKITTYILSDDKKKPTKTYAHLDTELIYRILREHKWSIKEFAKYIGVDYSSVCAWLRGGGIKKTTLNKLSKVLHISEEDLVK